MLFSVGCLNAAPSLAADEPVGAGGLGDTSSLSASKPRAPFRAPLGTNDLDRQRGGADTRIVNEQRLAATLSQNVASDLTTGNNAINDGSFLGASGFPMVIQNSGNNVIIQNSTILNLNLK